MERRLILDAVRRDGMQLGSTEEKYKDDPDIVFAAVTQNGEALQFASDKQRSNKQVVLAAVQQDGSALADVAPRSGLDDDREQTTIAMGGESQVPESGGMRRFGHAARAMGRSKPHHCCWRQQLQRCAE